MIVKWHEIIIIIIIIIIISTIIIKSFIKHSLVPHFGINPSLYIYTQREREREREKKLQGDLGFLCSSLVLQ